MKILWVDFTLPYLLKDADYPVGGWAVELQSWLAGCEAAGHEAGVLTWAGAQAYVGRELPFSLVESYDPRRGPKVLKYLTHFVPAMQQAVAAYAPDVVIQACAAALTGMTAHVAGRAGVPFVYRGANDMDFDDRHKARLKLYEQWLYRYGLRKSAMVVCQNDYQYEGIARVHPDKPAIILPNPYRLADASPPAPADARGYIAWIGIFQYQKNLPLLRRIATALPDVPFRIAGARGRTVDAATEEALAGLETLPNVTFAGYLRRGEVMRLLDGAVALLNTSRYKGFSNTYLESFGRGTPVIAPRGADPAGIIGRLGLGRAIADEEGFAPAIRDLMAKDGAYTALGDRCRSYVVEMHDPARLTEELVAALRPVVGG